MNIKKRMNQTLMMVALFGVAHLGAAPLVGIALEGGAGTVNDSASTNGIYWNRTANNDGSPSIADLVHAETGLSTGISFSSINPSAFGRAQDNLPTGPILYDGISFPNSVLERGRADNFGTGRDGLMSFRFVIPESLVSQNEFKINSVLGSNSSPNTFEMNIGGAWGGTSDRTFTGGNTISGGGSTTEYSFVTLSNVGAVYDPVAETYTLDLQYGFTGSGSSGAMTVRAITVTVIPEPGTLALVGIALGSLLLFRRR
ncbi:MAG: PEP-CTERM sorting domain-containing protein [Verrucomicrobia bacterium]|nr:PEP-CTERM sorting domain-containing protein [Verrucomicrobiota bacterium]